MKKQTNSPARGYDPNNKVRKRLERERKTAAGPKRYEVWILPEYKEKLREVERESREIKQ